LYRNRLQKNGSYTIELALLMPIILVIFIIIIYSSYYMHDRVVIERACYVSALRGLQCAEEERIESVAGEELEKELEGLFLGKWKHDSSVNFSGEILSVDFKGEMAAGQGLLKKIIGDKLYRYDTEYELNNINETKYLREYSKGK